MFDVQVPRRCGLGADLHVKSRSLARLSKNGESLEVKSLSTHGWRKELFHKNARTCTTSKRPRTVKYAGVIWGGGLPVFYKGLPATVSRLDEAKMRLTRTFSAHSPSFVKRPMLCDWWEDVVSNEFTLSTRCTTFATLSSVQIQAVGSKMGSYVALVLRY